MFTINERELRQPVEGNMLKFTNVVKGWQYRYFVLDPERGCLDYYIEKPEHESQVAPRGSMALAGAVVSPSDEDDQTFTITSIDGEPYKLRTSVKDRQFWIQRLRAAVQLHTDALGQTSQSLQVREHRSPSDTGYHPSRVKAPPPSTGLSAMDALATAHSTLQQAALVNQSFCCAIESLPSSAQRWKPTEPKLLMAKATSQAALAALNKCFEMLQTQHFYNNQELHRGHLAKGSKKPIFNVPRKPTRRVKASQSTPKELQVPAVAPVSNAPDSVFASPGGPPT